MDETTLELKVAEIIAKDLVKRGIDLNEVSKALAYLRGTNNWRNSLTLMKRLAQTGAVRSQQTQRYYQTIYDICRQHIGADASAAQAGRILGWAVRLARLPRLERMEQSTQAFQKRKPPSQR